MSFEWQTLPSGLKIRQDEFSWQGACVSDPRFFLRRDKFQTQNITDLLFGDLDDNQVASLLTKFLDETGGISGDGLVFRAIASAEDPNEHVVAIFDRIDGIGRRCAGNLSVIVARSFLDPDGGKWKAVLLLK